MAALQCDICGGKLMGRTGGIFECDSCGMQYDTAWAKEKIQQIQGTVKVEGTVAVQGTVKIDGPVKVEGGDTADSLVRRGYMELDDLEYEAALRQFKKAISRSPKSAEAYLGAVLADCGCADLEALDRSWAKNPKYDHLSRKYYQDALKFANPELKQKLQELANRVVQRKLEKEAEDARIQAEKDAAEATRKAAEEADRLKRQADIKPLNQYRSDIRNVQNMMLPIRLGNASWTSDKNHLGIWLPNGEFRYDRKPGSFEKYELAPEAEVAKILENAKKICAAQDLWFVLNHKNMLTAYEWSWTYTDGSNFDRYRYAPSPVKTVDMNQISGVLDFEVRTGNFKIRDSDVDVYIFRKNSLITLRRSKGYNHFKEIQNESVTWPDDARISWWLSRGEVCCICPDGTVLDPNGRVIFQNVLSITQNMILTVDGCVLHDEVCENWRQIAAASSAEKVYSGSLRAGLRMDGKVIVSDEKGTSELPWQDIVAIHVTMGGTLYGITNNGKLLLKNSGKPVLENLFRDMTEVEWYFRLRQIPNGLPKYREQQELESKIGEQKSRIQEKNAEVNQLTGFFNKGKREKAEKELDILKRELSHMEERMKSLAADISIALSALERGL